jgi:hypothetical protein
MAAALAVCAAFPAAADERIPLGFSRLFTNDAIGDTEDRWRSGSYSVSYLRGPAWQGELPERFGSLLEWRLRAEIITPEDITNPVIGTDRRYVGALSLGLHTHFRRAGTELSFGADLVATGPQTGIGRFQKWAHDLVGAPKPRVLGSQIGDGVYPTVLAEAGRELRLGRGTARFRPFVEAQAGAETLLRLGGDFTFGRMGLDSLRLRDVTTGQRTVAVPGAGGSGLSFVMGGDVAWVADSHYLPSSLGYRLTDSRNRLRAGVHYEGRRHAIFYGLTWLGEEFTAQPDSQIVGSLSLRLNF